MSSAFRSLTVRNYRIYASGQVVSNTGTWLQRVAQDWLVLKLTDSGTALGITTALQFLPMLLSPWGGVLADRYNKRRLLMVTQCLMGVLALLLGGLDLAGVVRVWHVYVLALLLGAVNAADNPTRQAFVYEMVGPRDLPNAVSLNSANFNLARIAGPSMGGLLISAVGTGWVFVINAASFGAVIASLLSIRARELHRAPRVAREPGQLREGAKYVRSRPDLIILLFAVFFVGTFGMNFQMTLALISKGVFHEGSSGFGLLSALMAVGSLAGSLLAARRRIPRMRIVLAAGLLFGVLEFVTGLMPNFATFALVLIPTGVASLTFSTTANAGMQHNVDHQVRGRVMGIYMLVFLGGTPLGAPLVGWVAQHWGARWSLLLGGIVSAVAVMIGIYAMSRVTGVRLRDKLSLAAWSPRTTPLVVPRAATASTPASPVVSVVSMGRRAEPLATASERATPEEPAPVIEDVPVDERATERVTIS